MQVDISPVAAVRKVADRSFGGPALLYEGVSISYHELVERAGCLAEVLAAGGVTTGRQVAYLGLNSPTFLVTYLACAWLGAVFVPVNFRLTAEEVHGVLRDCESHTLVVEPGHRAVVDALTRDAEDWRQLLIDDDPSVPVVEQPGRRWTLLSAALAEAPRPARQPVRCDSDDLAILLLTSGTTGRPKGVQLTYGNIWWSGVNVDSVADTRRSDVNLAVAPLFHVGTLNTFTLRNLTRGGTTVIRRKFDPDQTLRDLVECRVNTFFAVPSMFAAIARAPGFADADLSELRIPIVAGAPVPPQLILDYADRGVMLQQVWGLTESVGFATYLPAELTVAKAGSAGKAVPYTEIRLIDLATGGVITEPDVRGQVCVRGATVTPGYWRNREATEAVIDTDGWLHSGDIGYLDSGGWLFIVDRLKDMIITSGENVYPAEVEHALTGCPGLVEVAVIGMAHDTRGEAVVAVATRAEGAELTLDVVRAYASAHLAQYKLPIRLHVVESIPRNAAGKLDKNALRASLSGQDSGASAGQQLAPVPASRNDHLLELVELATTQALGYRSPNLRDGRSFEEMGLDSLAVVELRDRLAEATGLRLPATLAFDYPDPPALTSYLRRILSPDVRRAVPIASSSSTVTVAPFATVDDSDPIAIVGMACRYPGRVRSPEDLWEVVASGVDAVSTFPTDRGWNLAQLYDQDPDHAGTTYTREGGFLDGVAEFDAGFFRISPREALAMDPQHRLLLETTWETLERAGIDPTTLRGSATGVFTGVMYNDYGGRFLSGAPKELEGYLGTGSAGSLASGRVSYAFGFEGPALSVDTACSSSLVALHLAVNALRRGECDLVLAGGVTVMATPNTFIQFSRQRGMSADGRCKSFAQSADGAGWSEGVGVLLLEKLSDARRHAHPVLALVRGTAVNQDGASNGLTAPNGPAQQRVIRAALADAHLSPADVDVVEAHGTGTRLGDPIEAQALLATYGQSRTADRPLWLGSIKSNIGHSQAAAGVAGVIKMVMAMRQGVVPRTLHVDEPTREVEWSTGAVRVAFDVHGWPQRDQPRRAGVSAFGISGTNAHVILEEAPSADPVPDRWPANEPRPVVTRHAVYPWILSGQNPEALCDQANRLREFVTAHPDTDTADLGWSLLNTRALFDHRAVVVAADRAQAVKELRALAAGRSAPGVVTGVSPGAGGSSGVGVLFTGQGAQRAGMGQELCAAFPVYADAFDAVCVELDRCLAGHAEHALREVVFARAGSELAGLLDRTLYTQAGLFAFEVALFRLVQFWGVRPDVLVGHSIGELSAAHVAGVLSLPDAAALIAARGRLMQSLPEGGVMVAVAAPEQHVRGMLQGRERVSIAAVNSPGSVVVSGTQDAVGAVVSELAAQGHKSRRLVVSHAFHSPLVDPMLEQFREVAQGLRYLPPAIPIISTVTGRLAGAQELSSPQYWVRQVRQTVRFADAVSSLQQQTVSALLELGPDGVLTAMAQDSLGEQSGLFTVALTRRDRPEPVTAITALAELFVRGVRVNWTSLLPGTGRRIMLPTYPFQRQRFWLDATTSTGNMAPASSESATSVAEPPNSELAQRLARLDTAIQLAVLTDLVRDEAAVVLGHTSSDQIAVSGTFKDAGFDSLTAVDLRNRLTKATGQQLSATLIYDYETPEAVARQLLSGIDIDGKTRPRPEQHLTLGGIYSKLAMRGKIKEMGMLAVGVAALRDTFDGVATFGRGARVLQLSHGDHAPHIICFPSLVALPGEMQYDRLSSYFQDMSDLSVVIAPGYKPDEPLASSIDALADVLAEATLRCAQGKPFALLGHSSGGLLAHAVGTHLEASGVQPMSVVLLDTFIPDSVSPQLSKALIYEIVARRPMFVGNFDDSGITVMMTYLQMFHEWQPQPLAAPTLVVRPKEGISGSPDEPIARQEWRTHWPLEHIETEVPGDHFTMNVEHAHTTAEAVRGWLSTLPVATPRPHQEEGRELAR
jgi:acyl transferase domain-containing protein/acyl-CoA synthetase (AMP-forming)/AMP-acid ligase II/surfactin synthase thioesterase subunit